MKTKVPTTSREEREKFKKFLHSTCTPCKITGRAAYVTAKALFRIDNAHTIIVSCDSDTAWRTDYRYKVSDEQGVELKNYVFVNKTFGNDEFGNSVNAISYLMYPITDEEIAEEKEIAKQNEEARLEKKRKRSNSSKKILFGKYKGKLPEVLLEDVSYCGWLISQEFIRDEHPKIYNIALEVVRCAQCPVSE